MLRKLLVISDNMPERLLLVRGLEQRLTCEVTSVTTSVISSACDDTAEYAQTNVILLDAPLKAQQTCRVLAQIRQKLPHIPIVLLAHATDLQSGAQFLSSGADDVLTRPVTTERLQASLMAQARIYALKTQLHASFGAHDKMQGFRGIFYRDASMQLALAWARAWAQRGESLWIDGEAGVGKTLLANAIMQLDESRQGRESCTMTAEGMWQTLQTDDALIRRHAGANLVLRNPLDLSRKQLEKLLPELMRQLKRHNVRLIVEQSSERNEKLDMRWMTEMEIKGRVTLPPLRERGDDAALLAQHFAAGFCASNGFAMAELSPSAAQWLASREWPGNVRELKRCVLAASMLVEGGRMTEEDLQIAHSTITAPRDADAALPAIRLFNDQGAPKSMAQIESEVIAAMLKRENGCMARTSRMLGIGRSTLYRKLGVLEEKNLQLVEAG